MVKFKQLNESEVGSMSSQVIPISDKGFPCPLCHGVGQLTRAEALDRLGASDFKEIAQTSAEEALRLMMEKRKDDDTRLWERFETEVNQRTEILRKENERLNQELDRFRRTGRQEEMIFAEEVRSWPGICLSEHQGRAGGDYILAYMSPSGQALPPEILVDNKDKKNISEDDITKLVKDAKKRNTPIAIVVTKDESQLRSVDKQDRFGEKDGVFVLRTTRSWLKQELDVLRPIATGIRATGADFLRNNMDLAGEVKRTLSDLAAIQKEIGTAATASKSAGEMLGRYAERLRSLCDECLERSAAVQHAAS